MLDQRKLLTGRIEELLEDHPLPEVLTSMPGIGVRTGARILIEVGDVSTFLTADHLAAYAGLAPATRSSDSSISGEQPPLCFSWSCNGAAGLRARYDCVPSVEGMTWGGVAGPNGCRRRR